ncbi:MAG: hypothetical protein ACHQ3P_09015 [Candidatus Limnocylindrales bacterium]
MATLAMRFGWSYDVLMAMSGPERRLWLAAAERVAPSLVVPAVPAGPTPEEIEAARLTTEAERRARLLELVNEMAARRRTP